MSALPYIVGVVIGATFWWFVMRPWQKREFDRERDRRRRP